MISPQSLLDIVNYSGLAIQNAITKSQYKNSLNDLPKINEVYSFFLELQKDHPEITIDSVPSLPEDLKKLTPGLYQKNNILICATAITPNEFKYKALYTGSLLNQSCLSGDLKGIYLSILKKCSDGIHYEPMSFSYLIRDEFFSSTSTRFIVPFLVLPATIPEELDSQWVYLAMRQLAKDLSPAIEYKYLLTEDKEIELMAAWGLYN